MPPAARLGDKAQAPVDAHGCPKCPHTVSGPAVTGAATVLINGKPAVRVSDMGIHTACCGPNMWTATMGSATVLIESSPAHRQTDMTTHCGGPGFMTEGSPDVLVGP